MPDLMRHGATQHLRRGDAVQLGEVLGAVAEQVEELPDRAGLGG